MTKLIAKQVHSARMRVSDDEMGIEFTDQKGRQSSVVLPLKVAAELMSKAIQGERSLALRAGGPVKREPGWQELSFIRPLQTDVQILPMLEPPAIALVFDRGTDRQLPVLLPLEEAGRISQKIQEGISECSRPVRSQPLS